MRPRHRFKIERRRARSIYRILPLVGSCFPRVSRRTITAMISSTAIPIPTLKGVITLGGLGVGVGVAVGGGAFFSASIDSAYCRRCGVSVSLGFSLIASL